MNIGVKFAKIGSTGIIMCLAILLVASLGVLLDTALPVHAATATCPTTPSVTLLTPSGAAGSTVSVSGSNIEDANCTPLTASTAGTITYEYTSSTDTTCSTPTPIAISSTAVWSTTTLGSFTDSFTWPTGSTAGTYIVCVSISGSGSGVIVAGSFIVTGTSTSTGTASISADDTSYTVGDDITVSGTGFPASTSVTVELQSSDAVTTTTLGTVTTDTSGAFTQDYTVPAHPLNSVVLIATSGSVTAKSSAFTVNAKAAAKPKAKPTPVPTPVPPAPVVIVATPTPAPAPTDTPTAVPTDTPIPTPTSAPTPVPTPVAVTHSASTPFNGSVVAGVAIGMGVLLGLGLLFLVGRFVLRRYVSPDPNAGQAQQAGFNANAGIPFAPTMAYPPVNGPFAPDPATMQQQIPFNGPVPPGNGPFAPEPPTIQQQVPFNSPVPPGNSGFTPAGVGQQPFPPNDWFASPN